MSLKNGEFANIIVRLCECKLCDGYNDVEGYTISKNIWEQTIIEIIIIFRCERKTMSIESWIKSILAMSIECTMTIKYPGVGI